MPAGPPAGLTAHPITDLLATNPPPRRADLPAQKRSELGAQRQLSPAADLGPIMLNPKIADHHLMRKACIYIRQSYPASLGVQAKTIYLDIIPVISMRKYTPRQEMSFECRTLMLG